MLRGQQVVRGCQGAGRDVGASGDWQGVLGHWGGRGCRGIGGLAGGVGVAGGVGAQGPARD